MRRLHHRLFGAKPKLLCSLLLASLVAIPAVAQDKSNVYPSRSSKAQFVPETFADETVLDINNITTWISDDGEFAPIDPYTGGTTSNGTFPKGTRGVVYAQGIVWGGQVNDGTLPRLRVNGSTYENGLIPGKVLINPATGRATGPDTYSPEEYHAWRVNINWLRLDYNQAAAVYYGISPSEVTPDQRDLLREWYEYDWANWPAEKGAPFWDRNENGTYEPAQDLDGDGVFEEGEGDIPGYPGAHQTIWIVANDLSGESEALYGSPSIGLEYQMTIWGYGFPSTDPLGNISFARARLIYTGTPTSLPGSTIDSMFVVQWVDPDIGEYTDDYAGSDPEAGLGYAYNSNANDVQYQSFGLPSPAVGWDFFQGPQTEDGDYMDMTAFVYFAAGSSITDPELHDYTGTREWYNLMRGVKPQPAYPQTEPFVNPITGEITNFTLSGNPVTGAGWVDGIELPPGDRRIVLATGPFDMALGDTVDVVIGQIGALGTNNLSSVSLLKFYDQAAQFAYDNDFQVATPPPAPNVDVVQAEDQVTLNWGNDLEAVNALEAYESQSYEFEGYFVYQLPSPDAPLSQGVRVATFDQVNTVTAIYQPEFNQETGIVEPVTVAILPNSGIRRYVTFTQDAIRGRPLANGVEYYYAVSSFGFAQDAPQQLLESPATIVTVTPQPPVPGSEVLPDPETAVEIQHEGASTAGVTVQIVDATELVSGSYEIRFGYYNPYTGVAADTLGAADTLTTIPEGLYEVTEYSDANALGVGSPFPLRWSVYRDGEQVSPWMPQMDPDSDVPATAAPIVEGLQVYVPYVTPGFADWTFDGNRWITGVNWGGTHFFGGADLNPFGTTLGLEELETVVMEFVADTTAGPADGWASKGAVYNGSTYVGTGYLPFAAYAVDAEGNRRQVNVSFRELAACGNLRWDLGQLTGDADCQGNGGSEYLFIHKSDYDEGASYDQDNVAQTADVMYFTWAQLRGDQPYLEDDFSLTYIASISSAPSDVYSFENNAPARNVAELLRESVDNINVFPNPYLGYSRIETSRYNKFVTFTHLPEEATLRIFNLAGSLVRVIEHDDGTQFERWDLNNQEGVPVASGVYLVHVETANGEKVLKLAVVQEEQILQYY